MCGCRIVFITQVMLVKEKWKSTLDQNGYSSLILCFLYQSFIHSFIHTLSVKNKVLALFTNQNTDQNRPAQYKNKINKLQLSLCEKNSKTRHEN